MPDRRAYAVVGSSWGDEGKGLVVDYLASQITGPKVVVRHNGGAQAGHTVVTPDGKRHVFSHFGSGTLVGAETYLAKHFVCNPLLLFKEGGKLAALMNDITPVHEMPAIAADPRCFITTPYDMLINQAVEDSRGDARHGSCGVGFGETIERNNYPAFSLWKNDLKDPNGARALLRRIRDQWVPIRCRQLGIPPISKDDTLMSDRLLERAVQSFGVFEEAVITAGAEFLERKAVIFEGAQGLALDMHSKNFPHVTRSKTGLYNVLPIAKVLGLQLDVIYVSRPYLTKHGAGPLPNEYTPNPPIVDETNTEHPYQGRLRFGRLIVDDLLERIRDDMKLAPGGTTGSVALTCTDHVDQDLMRRLRHDIGIVRLTSSGPTRAHVIEQKRAAA